MVKKNNSKRNRKDNEKKPRKPLLLNLPENTKKWIGGLITFLIAIIVVLSFFGKAGIAGDLIFNGLNFLIGKTIFILPLILLLAGMVFLLTEYQKFLIPTFLAVFILILGFSAVLNYYQPAEKISYPGEGGWVGYLITWPFLKFFGPLVTNILFGVIIIIAGLIFWHLIKQSPSPKLLEALPQKPPLIKRIFGEPKFKLKEVEPSVTFEKETKIAKESFLELKNKPVSPLSSKVAGEEYQRPPLDLLDSEKGVPTAGDVRVNSAIIKKTLENFDIPVDMSEINIGPTVTQYTLKPADGIKLSKITTLSNDLAMALASHPIRIEAPIPGKPLVGIEIPNKIRAQVRLKDLISEPQFQNSPSNLAFVLGRDVSGNPIYADLARMPHLLVAGSTGTGKTIFLNSLILSLLYRNSPSILRFILIDPKRVEFSVYQELPHLLSPVIFDAQKTINVLKWLVSEMERRFEIFAEDKTRDINSYNELALKDEKELMPYIILIVDELADLMSARGREVEAGIVRLAQMARAVGIHLVLATQRPSVEVITGLIKANITSRITFQVASQVDSRTVLDAAGAEKLLGRGDMLFISAEIVKPKRIQGSYVSEKEVKRVTNHIKTQNSNLQTEKIASEVLENQLAEDLARSLKSEEELEAFPYGEDPLYEEAKRTIIEAKKASASLLQRRLRIGYARAARLIDMLEERGEVGPGEGAKPREVYFKTEEKKDADEEGWQKV